MYTYVPIMHIIKLPTVYNVIDKKICEDFTQLKLQKQTDRKIIFWWQIPSMKAGQKISCTFDVRPPMSYYKYWGNVLSDNGIIGVPLGLSSLEQNSQIDFSIIKEIPDRLQDIFEYE